MDTTTPIICMKTWVRKSKHVVYDKKLTIDFIELFSIELG